jgi:hypothetical protein
MLVHRVFSDRSCETQPGRTRTAVISDGTRSNCHAFEKIVADRAAAFFFNQGATTSGAEA